MYINNKLAVVLGFLNVTILGYVYYFSNVQRSFSNVIVKTSDNKEKEYVQRENEFSHSFSSNAPTIWPSAIMTKEYDESRLPKLIYTTPTRKEQYIKTYKDGSAKKTAKVGAKFTRPKLNLSSLPPDLYKMAKPVFDLLPKAYLPGYKSPCWMLKGSLKCLPYFYILGMPKCGTTDLWDKMAQHPDVQNNKKEWQWWARGRLKRGNLTLYTSHFLNLVEQFKLDPTLKSRLIIGDGSASTFWDNGFWERWDGRRYEGPKYVTADVMHAAQPDAKLLLMLRNPVSRLYSGYLYFNPLHHVNISVEHFHKVVVEVLDRFNECLQTMSFRGCTYSIKRVHHEGLHARLLVGLYAVYVRDWLRAYPRDQLKIMRLEDWHENCTGLLPEVFDFLNLEKVSDETIFLFCERKSKNVNKVQQQNLGDMLPQTRKLLEDFYEGPNKELSLLLGDDKYLWRS